LLQADVLSYVATLRNHPDASNLNLDPMLVIEAHRLLSTHQVSITGFEQLIDKIANELESQPGDTLKLGRVRLMAERLRTFGYSIPNSSPGKDAARLLRLTNAWLTTSTTLLDDMLDHLFADKATLSEEQTSLLSLIALAELRNYRLDIGSKILRLIVMHGVANEETNDALTYMLLQRRNDGAYGFATPFDEQNWQRSSVDLKIYLPLTLNVLWTLCEVRNATALPFAPMETVTA
jgi:hypothetical protein